MTIKIFFDTEFTGLHQNTTLISIGAVSDTGETFYAEFDDFDYTQVDVWIEENVINNLFFYGTGTKGCNNCSTQYAGTRQAKTEAFGNTEFIKDCLSEWLISFHDVEMWSDCLSYDWVLFNELFGGAMYIPRGIYYVPFDVCTMFKLCGVDPDISREEFVGISTDEKHNALHDAKVIKMCYERLATMCVKEYKVI